MLSTSPPDSDPQRDSRPPPCRAAGRSRPRWHPGAAALLPPPPDGASSRIGEQFHTRGAWTIRAGVGLHIAAVAWHRFVKRDSVTVRMLPDIR